MTKQLKKIVHFLSSVSFALLLIAMAAVMVIFGTFVESKTDSHRQAAYYTYESTFFSVLLLGFFINILLSALRRFPFKVKHIPFLITHLGLLMVIAGQLVKKHAGIQGSMSIVEGSSSQELTLSDSYTLLVESKDSQETKTALFSIPKDFSRYSKLKKISGETFNEDLKITLLGYAPNVSEKFESWIKTGKISLREAPPFEIEESEKVTPFTIKAKLIPQEDTPWNLKGIKTKNPASLALDYYKNNVVVIIKDSKTNLPIATCPLYELIKSKIHTKFGSIRASVEVDIQPIYGIKQACLLATVKNKKKIDKITIDLIGKHALINKTNNEILGKPPISIDLIANPSLLFVVNALSENTLIFGWTQNGQILNKMSLAGSVEQLIAYDDGYLGYSTELKLPLQFSRVEKEQDNIAKVKSQLQRAIQENALLSPPLAAFKKACDAHNENFVELICHYLSSWNQLKGWLFPQKGALHPKVEQILYAINWEEEPAAIRRSCMWLSHFFDRLDPVADNTIEIIKTLKAMQWPQAENLEQELKQTKELSPQELLQKISLQIFTIGEELPELNTSVDPARAFSAYMRAYNIHLAEITTSETETSKDLVIETAVTTKHTALPRDKTLENEVPAIFLRVEDETCQDFISLSYDKSGSALKWPIKNAKLQLRFQPEIQKIPHSLRLRQARQLTYADTSHPYSYECDLLVTNEKGEEVEKTISMNNVYETSDGYRFYLANISPADEASLKRVQIVVNKDPAKYVLTYPGGFMIALGASLLFWFQPYKKKRPTK